MVRHVSWLNFSPCAYLAHALVGVAACYFVWLLYSPGVSGPFIFDDYGTLAPLGSWGVIDSIEKFKLYVFSGFTGPGGRPVALFTFALNADTWPAASRPFIQTNILIHIFNGILLFFVIKKLLQARALDPSGQVLVIASGAAVLWVLHPIHTSSVLYIVQRMTLLSATFSLLAIWLYIQGRAAVLGCRFYSAILWLFGAATAAGLAFFSKENAVLLPIQIALVEWYLRRVDIGPRTRNRFYRLIIVGIALASAVVFIFLFKQFAQHTLNFWATGIEETYGRSFTLYERLFTQLRVVGDYLIALVVPKMQSSGVFHDGYPISRSLFSPFSTLIWLIVHGSIITVAILYRRKLDWLFFGIMWFYCSHLLESTVVMLEIKFEHRNYIPSMGLFFVGAYAISLITSRFKALSFLAIVSLIYAAMLYLSASLWGKPLQAAMVWSENNTRSSRALNHAAQIALEHGGDSELSKEFMRKSILVGQSLLDELKYVMIFCETYDGAPPDWDKLAYGVEYEPRDWSLYQVLTLMLYQSVEGKCGILPFDGYRSLIDAYRRNPVYHNSLSIIKIDELEIHAALHFGRPEVALELEENRDELAIPLAFRMNRAQILASYGYLGVAASNLKSGIELARQYGGTDAFTIREAEEMLELILSDLRKNPDAK